MFTHVLPIQCNFCSRIRVHYIVSSQAHYRFSNSVNHMPAGSENCHNFAKPVKNKRKTPIWNTCHTHLEYVSHSSGICATPISWIHATPIWNTCYTHLEYVPHPSGIYGTHTHTTHTHVHPLNVTQDILHIICGIEHVSELTVNLVHVSHVLDACMHSKYILKGCGLHNCKHWWHW